MNIIKGTHSNCPSKIEQKDGSLVLLSEYLQQQGDKSIGASISKHFYDQEDSILKRGDLPFLFKVLSINQALSIQAHPNRKLAAELHARDPKNYPDSNHKPEMLIAISESFEAMCGFRLATEIASHMANYGELADLCDQTNCADFRASPTEPNLRKCFHALMNKDDVFVRAKFDQLKTRLETSTDASSRDYLDSLFLRLASQYPNDVGCFSIYLLNCIKLEKGEAIYLSANVPHAYLFGDGVECMATSDNVVRAGLTPKFKDVNVLCDMLDYKMRSARDNTLSSTQTKLSLGSEYLLEYRPNVDEFSVQQIRINARHLVAKQKFVLPKCESGSILIINELSANIAVKSYFCLDSGEKIAGAKAGHVFYIDAHTDVYFVVDGLVSEDTSNDSLVMLAFRAYSDIKN